MKLALLAVLSIKVIFAFAQYEKTFIPSPFQDTIPSHIYDRLKKRLEVDKTNVTTKGKEGNYIKSLYDQRFEYVVNSFNDDYFILDHPLTSTLRKIADRIYDANPDLPREVNVYTYRSSVPNALSFGEGTIGVMLGLLERLETEDQLAYILCHEFAHYYARHAERNFARLAALNYDKDLKYKINDIKNSPYRKYSKLKALFHSLDLSVTRHSRNSEFEADSLGLLYYLKTGYNRHAPLRVMQLLENADTGLYRNNIDFKKHFSFEAFPFKDSWTSYSKSNIVYAPVRDSEDTLKTHPNCQKRFDRLKRQLGIKEADTMQLKAGTSFKSLSQLASLEIISSEYHFRHYGKALFYALVLTDSFPNNPYPHAMVAKSLYQLYRAQKDHNLHEVLELPNPRQEENYDRYLTFVNKLRLSEFANLAYEYVTTRPAGFYADEEFIHALWRCSTFEFSKMDEAKIVAEYEQLYPEGKYIPEMKNHK